MDPPSGQDSETQLESNDAIVSRLAKHDKVPWYCKPNLRRLYLLIAPTCLGVEMTNGFSASLMNSLQSVPSWLEYYHHPRSAALGLMASMYALGCITAVPFVPSVVDKIGRRRPILLGGLISIFASILQGSASNFTMFCLSRFILGVGSVFCVVAATSLIGELSHPNERAIMCSFYNTTYDIGAIVAATVTLGTFSMTSSWGWRFPSFLQVFPGLLQVTFIWFLPESPRWLISKGRGGEAYTILVKYHAEGDESSEFVKAEYIQIKETLEAELKISRLHQTESFSNTAMRKRFVVAAFLGLCMQWSGVGLITLFLSSVLDSIGVHDNWTRHIINIANPAWSYVNCTIAALIVPQYSRRKVFLFSTVSLFLVFLAWTVATAEYSSTHNQVAAQLVLGLIFVYGLVYNIAFTALPYTYLVELFPFHVRAKGIGFYQWCFRGAAFFDQFVNPIGIDLAGWRWYIVYCVWIAFEVVVIYVMFPETSGRTLEELTFLYEEEREAFVQSGVQTLHLGRGETETYGTMEAGSRVEQR